MGWLRVANPLLDMLWALDRFWLGAMCVYGLLGAAMLWRFQRRAEDPIVRAQMTWLRNGLVYGLTPFGLFYAIPYILGFIPSTWMQLSLLFLPLVPLCWGYAILRYRLMDAGIIFQQGYIYTLATLAVLACMYGVVYSVTSPKDLTPTAVIALIGASVAITIVPALKMSIPPLRTCASMSVSPPSWLLGNTRNSMRPRLSVAMRAATSCARTFSGWLTGRLLPY